jgi:hypothetical protein
MFSFHGILSADTMDVADLGRIHEDSARVPAPDLIKALIEEIEQEDPRTQPRASWLLLRYATDSATNSKIDPKHLEAAIEILGNAPAWESRLHLCQLFSRMDCPPTIAGQLFEQLTRCAADKRAFLRAWALTALHNLSRTNPDYKKEVAAHLRAARADISKAVQARLRQLTAKPSRPQKLISSK